MKGKMNPGAWIAIGLMTLLLWQFIGWWAIPLAGASLVMYLAMYDYEQQKRQARKMSAELRMDARRALAEEYKRRHPDKA